MSKPVDVGREARRAVAITLKRTGMEWLNETHAVYREMVREEEAFAKRLLRLAAGECEKLHYDTNDSLLVEIFAEGRNAAATRLRALARTPRRRGK